MSGKTVTLLVSEETEATRLDRYLAESLPHYSREYLKSLIQTGQVVLEGFDSPVTKPSFGIEPGQQWVVSIPEAKPLDLQPEDLDVEVVYEDDVLLVVNKPSGMLTHPVGSHTTGTLVNALLFHCQGGLSGINGVERPGIVHRLDKDTSGLLVVAKTDTVHRELQQLLQQRLLKRCYRTLVQGQMQADFGTIDTYIGRDPKYRDRMAVVPNNAGQTGRHAVTHWKRLETVGTKATAMHVQLDTGRTHQIRVHMAHINHAIFNDPVYSNGLSKQLGFEHLEQGQVLQAYQLHFPHPISKELIKFELEADGLYQAAAAFLLQR